MQLRPEQRGDGARIWVLGCCCIMNDDFTLMVLFLEGNPETSYAGGSGRYGNLEDAGCNITN